MQESPEPVRSDEDLYAPAPPESNEAPDGRPSEHLPWEQREEAAREVYEIMNNDTPAAPERDDRGR